MSSLTFRISYSASYSLVDIIVIIIGDNDRCRTAPQNVQKSGPAHQSDFPPEHQERRVRIQPQGCSRGILAGIGCGYKRGRSIPTQCNSIISKYKDAAEKAGKNDDMEKELRKLQEGVDKEKERSREEF